MLTVTLLTYVLYCPKLRTSNGMHLFFPGSDVARLFAKRSVNLRAPSEIAHTINKECVHTLTRRACMLTSLPGDDETEYS